MFFALKAGSDRQIWIHSVGIGRLQVHGTSGMFVTSQIGPLGKGLQQYSMTHQILTSTATGYG